MNKPTLIESFTSISFTRSSLKEQTLFAKRMSFLVKAGVPLVESLSLIRAQTKSKQKCKVLEKVIEDVNNGQYLAASLRKHRHMFNDFAVNIIRVGEESGILSQNLAYLADELKKKDDLRRKVVGAMLYPLVITLATFGITGLLTVYIFPKILPIFSSLNVVLPLSTRILIAVSNFLSAYGILSIFVSVLIGIGFAVLKFKSEKIQLYFDKFILALPLFGNIVRSYNLSNFCRTLGLLIKSGVQISNSLVMIAETTTNRAYRTAFASITESVLRGEPMSRELSKDTKLFPDIVTHMIMVGESTGTLALTLSYLSEMYEGEVEDATKNLSTAIEPILMVVMGCLVGFLAVSIITPIYEITQNLHP